MVLSVDIIWDIKYFTSHFNDFRDESTRLIWTKMFRNQYETQDIP